MPSPPKRRVKLAFVGCGVISQHHLTALCNPLAADADGDRRVDVTVVVDPSAENRAKTAAEVEAKTGARPAEFESLAAAFAADPDRQLFDACDVMVPSVGTLHETVGVEAMAGGRHVLLEKPIAVSPASADRLCAAGAALPAGQVFMVAENSQYWPEVVEVISRPCPFLPCCPPPLRPPRMFLRC